jgi:hypothetical protein
MYQCKHFGIKELVSPAVFSELGERAWEICFDDRLLITIDAIRDYFDLPCFINNWEWGGIRKFSGFREALCPIGASYSQHRFGRAADMVVEGMVAEEVRQAIIKNRKAYFPYITEMELDVDWLHIGCRNHTPLRVFRP